MESPRRLLHVRRLLILIAILAGSAVISPEMRAPLRRNQVVPAIVIVSIAVTLLRLLLTRR